jgi:hypothetical protein
MRSRCPELNNRAVSSRPDDAGVEVGSRGVTGAAGGVAVPVALGASRAGPQCG